MNQEILIDFSRIDDIIIARVKPEVKIDLESAKEMVRLRIEFAEGKDYKLIVVYNKLKQADKSARDYFGLYESNEGIIGGALVSNSV